MLQFCSEFDAGSVVQGPKQGSKLDITGLFAALCRHDIVIKMLNMTTGER